MLALDDESACCQDRRPPWPSARGVGRVVSPVASPAARVAPEGVGDDWSASIAWPRHPSAFVRRMGLLDSTAVLGFPVRAPRSQQGVVLQGARHTASSRDEIIVVGQGLAVGGADNAGPAAWPFWNRASPRCRSRPRRCRAWLQSRRCRTPTAWRWLTDRSRELRLRCGAAGRPGAARPGRRRRVSSSTYPPQDRGPAGLIAARPRWEIKWPGPPRRHRRRRPPWGCRPAARRGS